MAMLRATNSRRVFDINELAPEGTYVATCIDIRDVKGVERKKYESDETEVVDLTAFLFAFVARDGRSYKVASRQFLISAHEKSGLFAFLRSWLGKPPQMEWDYCEMKGRPALLTVDHVPSRRNPNRVYAGIASISPLPPGYQVPAPAPQTPPVTPAPTVPPVEPKENDELPF